MDNKNQINKETGEIDIGNTKLQSTVTLNDFLLLPLAQEIIGQRKGQYKSLLLRPQLIGETLFNVAIYFGPNDKLFKLSLSICYDGKIRAWENWTEEGERKLKGEHDKWLFTVFGKPHRFGAHGEVIYEYGWGEVVSAYDPRSAASNLTIRYY